MVLAIPRSFEVGVVEAIGPLKEEVDKAIALKAQKQQADKQVKVITSPIKPKKNIHKRIFPLSTPIVTGF